MSDNNKTTGGYIPGISLDNDNSIGSMAAVNKVTAQADKKVASSLSIGDVNTTTEDSQSKKVNMATGRPVKRADSARRKADISELAKPKDKNEPIPGVDTYKSPQDEVFKPGGPFDKYVKEKTAEMKERMALEKEKRIIEELDGGEDEVTDIPDLEETDEEKEDRELEMVNQVTSSKTVRVNAVFDDEEETAEEEPEQPKVEVNEADNSVPFYQAVGYQDDYEYPDVDISEFLDDMENEEDDDMIDAETLDKAIEDQAADAPEEVVEEVKEEAPVVKPAEPVEEEDDDIVEGDTTAKHIAFTNDLETLEDLEKESNEFDLPDEDARLEELKSEISRKIKPKAASLNLKGFTIASKSTASNKIFETKETSAGKWILPTTGICVQMREISGQKIEYIREQASLNTPTGNRNTLKTIYDHIVTPKPQSFEAWTKSIAFADYDHLFMPIYMAAFSDSNYMPQTCVMEKGKVPKVGTGCGKMFLSDNIDIMELVKFKDKESKKKFWDLYNSDRTNSEGLYVSEVIPVSTKFAIEFCEPTLYSVLFENGNFGREFNEKYENVISFMPYIGRIFWIDAKRSTLVPVSYKKYDNNASKTAKSKVIRYSNVLDSLTTDEYTAVVALISSINEKNDWFTYRIPEMTCPECGRTIPEEETTAAQLVFTRHRLGVLANTSIN